MAIQFVVENAGCDSCGALVSDALSGLGTVESIDIDEEADAATVRLEHTSTVSMEEVDRILESVSAGSGHGYRVQPGSWTALVSG